MKSQLTISGGSRDGEVVILPTGRLLRFGTHGDCDVLLRGDGISRHHFQIEHRGSFYLITDLNSTNGTRVGGHKVASRILQDGDTIQVGQVSLTFSHTSTTTILMQADEVSDVTLVGVKASAPGTGRIVVSKNYDTRIDLGSSLLVGATNDSETVERMRTALNTIYRISNLVLTEDSLDLLFNTVTSVVMEVLDPDRVFLVMWHASDQSIEPVVVRRKGDRNDPTDTSYRALADDELGPSTQVLRESILNSLAVISEDARIDPRFQDATSVKAAGIRSAMCVPVRSSTQRIGAIYVDTLAGARTFAEHELELLAAIGRQAGLAIERARVYEDMETLFYSCVRTLVTSIEAKDVYTHGHSERVAAFAITIAEELGVDADTMDSVRLGALLHDIGKIGVPEKILTKPARLTPDEVKVIREHPIRGAEILSHIKNIPNVVAAARWHHEMFNGRGYPDGLHGNEIPLTARIVSVADSFDAMTSNRSYRRNFDVNEAISEFQRCAGDQFAPEVCEVMQVLLRSGRIIPCNDLFARGIDVASRVY